MTCVVHGGSVCPRRGAAHTRPRRRRSSSSASRRLPSGDGADSPRRRAGCSPSRRTALVDLPPFPSSAMDGYAVRAADTPGTLPVVFRIAAGAPAPRSLAAGEAMGIATGGVVPDGADAVVPHELVVENDNTSGRSPTPLPQGANIRPVGRDVVAGGIVALRRPAARPRADRRARRCRDRRGGVRPPSACGRPDDRDGASAPGHAARPRRGLRGERRDARRAARGRRRRGDAGSRRSRTTRARTAMRSSRASSTTCSSPRAVCRSARTTSSGGSRPSSGVEEVFWRVAVRPGKPVSFGVRGRTLVFGLPGNPVSTLVGCELFVRPGDPGSPGATDPGPRWSAGTLAVAVERNPGRDDLVRARSTVTDEGVVLEPVSGQESHMIVRAAEADALVLAPARRGRARRPASSVARTCAL